MNKGKMTVLMVMAAVLLTAAIFVLFFSFTLAGNKGQVLELPTMSSDGEPGSAVGISEPDITTIPESLIEITPDNVKRVIESLKRPENYSAGVTVSLFWLGGQSTVQRQMWVSHGLTRWKLFDANGQPYENQITGHGETYIWNEGDDRSVQFPDGTITSDDVGQIPTYEDILSAEDGNIFAAVYEEHDSEPCVKVVVNEQEKGSQYFYWVSLDKGILLSAEAYSANVLVYRMSLAANDFNGATPDKSYFQLPDGVNLIDEVR